MGAASFVHRFDAARLRRDVAPAILALVRRGTVSESIRRALVEAIDEAHRVEAKYPDHYDRHHRPSDDLDTLSDGLGLVALGSCETVRADLGVVDDVPLLVRIDPSPRGSCLARTCPDRERCPLHREAKPEILAETFETFVRHRLEALLDARVATLGRMGRWCDVAAFISMSHGRDPSGDAPFVIERTARDAVYTLLLRLMKRGAAIGWDDGGHGEGLLGWLDAGEVQLLVETLPRRVDEAGLDEAAQRSLMAIDPYLVSDVYPASLAMVRAIADGAIEAARERAGIAVVRR